MKCKTCNMCNMHSMCKYVEYVVRCSRYTRSNTYISCRQKRYSHSFASSVCRGRTCTMCAHMFSASTAITKPSTTHFTFIRLFTCMSSKMSCEVAALPEPATAYAASIWHHTSVYTFVHVKGTHSRTCILTHVALVWLDPCMRSHMSSEITI